MKTYPQTYCPPALFELTTSSRRIYNIIVKGDISLEEVADSVLKMLGSPRSLSEKALLNWCDNYRDFWTPILAEIFKSHGNELAFTVYEKVFLEIAKNGLTEVIDDFPYSNKPQLLSDCKNQIDNPWIMMFLQWHIFGRKEYVVSSGLSQRLKKTKLKGYPADDLKLPYDCMYLDLQNYGPFGSALPEGCLIVNFDDAMGIAVLTKEQKEEFPRMLDINLGPFSLDHALKEALKNYQSHKAHNTKNFVKPWEHLFRYVINVVLYATMPDAEQQFEYFDKDYKKLKRRVEKLPKNSKKKKRLTEKLSKKSKEQYIHLGGSITVDRTKPGQEITDRKTGRKITVRSLVSGHWRNQPYGEQKLQRKRIWIEPFWRGPEHAPITQKQHNLK